MQVEWSGYRNAAGLGWWKTCGWVGLVAEMQMDWASGRNAAGLVR